MISDPQARQRLIGTFDFLSGADLDFQAEFLFSATQITLAAGQTVGRQGDSCAHLALVIEGQVRVYRLGESGREITLYRIGPGGSCVLTASCILRHGHFPAFAQCDGEVQALLLSQGQVTAWLQRHQPWRDFVFGLVSERPQEVIALLDAVVFQRLEQRLARYLLGRLADPERSDPSAAISLTHQGLATNLGSAREVVSRLLAALEDRGILHTARGSLRVLDQPALAAIASAP